MEMNIKEQVEQIIQERWDELKNPKELFSQFSIEKQTNEGYNGRQLLELFQNCEDEGAEKVHIHWDTNQRIIQISNDGPASFSIKGYNSLFYPGLSSKVSSDYIGNKGLGFRSIINWAEKVAIISNNFELVFDKSLQRETLIDKIGYSQREIDELQTERGLRSDIYPVPFLNCCRVHELSDSTEFTTSIRISYRKEFEKDIQDQISSINEKTLLFLRNISTIKITGNYINNTISVVRQPIDETTTKIDFGNTSVFVISKEGEVDVDLNMDAIESSPKKYSIKIAFNYDLSFKDDILYNYFKTKIPFNFPFVAHASIDLDQNRNYAVETKANPFIFRKMLELHFCLVDKLKQNATKSWLPYQAIDKDNEHIYEPYTQMVQEVWDSLAIYPTLSGMYENRHSAKNLGLTIARFMDSHNLQSAFPNQIYQLEGKLGPLKYIGRPDDYSEAIERIACDLDINQRADFVRIILNDFPSEKFGILVDEKNKVIAKDDYVFTNKTSENQSLEVPSYSHIRFIHADLQKRLITILSLQNESHKSRALKEKLDKLSNVHSFEPVTVIKRIISETVDKLSRKSDNRAEIIKELYQNLYHNYTVRGDNPTFDYDARIPCLNSRLEECDIRTLQLSTEFDRIKRIREKFGNLFELTSEIAQLSSLGLSSFDRVDVEEFLIWLGVNDLFLISKTVDHIEPSYGDFIKRHFDYHPSNGELHSIQGFNDLLNRKGISINHILGLFYGDTNIRKIFSNFSLGNSPKETLKYRYYSTKTITNFKNHIYYQFVTQFDVENYLISDNKGEKWFNPFKVEYEFLYDINPKLDRTEVNRILTFFGAKSEFNDLNIEFLRTKATELADRNNPNGAQVFYKNLVRHYNAHKIKLLNLKLYARVLGEIKVVEANSIFFSDRIQLPQSLTNKFPTFYFPSRSGGATAIELFGLKNLDELNLELVTIEPNEEIKEDFQYYLSEAKPFILAYRLDRINSEKEKKVQADKLNKMHVICCSKLTCSIEGEKFEVDPYNYVFDKEENTFYVFVPKGHTMKKLQEIKPFVDNLSDVFLKALGIHENKKTFESVLRQSIEDNLYDVNNELGEGLLDEAKIHLGILSIPLSIWKGIFRLKNVSFSSLTEDNLDEYIANSFPELTDSKSFSGDHSIDDLKKIRQVFFELSINLSDFNLGTDYMLSFDRLYQLELLEIYESKKKLLKNQLWLNRSFLDKTVQKEFINEIYRIENLFEGFVLSKTQNSYDFNEEILSRLNLFFKDVQFNPEDSNKQDYDSIEAKNSKEFNADELLIIRKDKMLKSLMYFEGNTDYIKSLLLDFEEHQSLIGSDNYAEYLIEEEIAPIKMDQFEIEFMPKSKHGHESPWLGSAGSGLSSPGKKKLGNQVEMIVKNYLESLPELYSDIEHIASTDEGAHYDIKYFSIQENMYKYVECKYFNGHSFLLSGEEKKFAEANIKKYEIWLVNKNKQIYCISNFSELGSLEPHNYKVHLKIKDYAIQNQRTST